jgi:transcriptional regulator with XRE-family HTH domain
MRVNAKFCIIMDYTHLQAEIKRRGMTVEEVAQKIGMGGTGLYAAFRNDSLRATKLLAICDLLGITLDQAVFGVVRSGANGYIEDRIADLENRVNLIESHLNQTPTNTLES